ncbi:MAG TPA: alpha-amylase [Candidatus Ozemobacteraceae bacterium]|nr:alpha-amylase [Candidatus Ozemobacteraceae bacterium]
MTSSSRPSAFAELKSQLERIATTSGNEAYFVPSLWTPVGSAASEIAKPKGVNQARWFLEHLRAIEYAKDARLDPTRSLNGQVPGGDGGNWICGEKIYNLMVRLATAYDHDRDGKLGGDGKDPTLNAAGIRESGTFLKSIALLGHIRRLGCTTIHLLPVTSIGHDGNKGVLGSPYAIKNAYRLEERQADPLVPMSVDDQCRAFVEACHMLGMRVIFEFVFRTASKDGDWIAEHPDWFYWIDATVQDRMPGETDIEKAKATYGNPVFSAEELAVIKDKVDRNDFHELPPPPSSYRGFFKLAPEPGTVHLNDHGQFRAVGLDPATGQDVEVRIPGAFADWPPDDNQPPWGDVTYLKMYRDEDQHHPRFNYIAYNTIRMYDKALARDEMANRALWDKIRDLVPHYQREFGIDGVMVDMGHAVPVSLMREIVDTARKIDPNFAFLSENFSIEESSVKAGYNAVVGYAWWVEYKRDGLYGLLDHVGRRGVPLSWFAAVENHNTPRAAARPGGEAYARYAFLLNVLLPRSIPFVHAGFELGETWPVNTGLDFTDKDLAFYRGKPLPLFDMAALNWDGATAMLDFTRTVLDIRAKWDDAIGSTDSNSFVPLRTGHEDIIAFIRRGGGQHVLFVLNRDLEKAHETNIDLSEWLPVDLPRLENLVPSGAAETFLPLRERVLISELPAGSSYLFAW